MKKFFYYLPILFLLMAACINTPTSNSGISFWASEYKPATNVVCEGGGLRFGNCIARKMNDSTCIGIAKFNGSHIALEIPCSVMFQSALDTISIEEDALY